MSPVQDSQPVQPQPPEPPAPEPPDDEGNTPEAGQPAAEPTATDHAATESAPSAAPAPHSQGSPSTGLVAVGILIGLCLVGGLLVMMVRRRLLRGDSHDAAMVSLMDSLRGMLRNGEITQEEFDAAKRSMVTRLSGKSVAGSRPGVQRPAGEDTGI